MPDNPYPDKPIAPVDPFSQTERMENLPMRQQTPIAAPAPAADEPVVAEPLETSQETDHNLRYSLKTLNAFLQWFATVLEVALALRFILKFIQVNPGNPFAFVFYSATDIVLFPFANLIPWQPRYLEISTLIAMLVYALTFWAIKRFLRIVTASYEDSSGRSES